MQNDRSGKTAASGFYSRMMTLTDARLVSDSTYNLLIGAMLMWGFIVNFLMVHLASPSITYFLWRNSESASTIMIVFLVGYFALCAGGTRLLRSENVLVDFLGYNMIVVPVGLLLCVALQGYGSDIIEKAVAITGGITLLMIVASTFFPAVFSSIGRGLGTALLATILVDLAAWLIFRLDLTIVDYAVVAIMSLYIGFDWARAWECQRTPNNAIAVAASLYLDIVNILLRVLRILNRSKSRK